MFPTEGVAVEWLESEIWSSVLYCPYCDSFNIQCGIRHSSVTHCFLDCLSRPQSGLKTGTVMKGTKLQYRDWVIAICLRPKDFKGMFSMKRNRDLGITQKSGCI